jgi:uridine phosphorylase
MAAVYHLDLSDDRLEGAAIALLPGDPARVSAIASTPPFERCREIANKREYRSWLGYIRGQPVVVTSTGIGGPSASIAVDELAQLGVRTFIRVGTTGAIQPHVHVGDTIVTTGAVRLDGASTHYAPIEYPAVAHHEIVAAAMAAAADLGLAVHAGVSASTDTFYPGQERYDSYSQYVIRRFQGATEELRRLHVLNYEMEAATLLAMTAAMGLRGGCLAGVVVNRTISEAVERAALERGERHGIQLAVATVDRLLR